METTLLIIEDDAATVRCYRRLFSQREPRLRVIDAGSLAEGRAAVQACQAAGRSFAAVVLDLRLPDGSGADMVASIREISPETPIVVVSAFLDDAVALELQVAEVLVLPKPVTAEVLTAAVFGNSPPAGDPASGLIAGFAQGHGLSRRQTQVLAGIVNGRSSKEIAASLGLSVNSVGAHARRLYAKAGCRSRSEVVRAVFGPSRQRGAAVATSPRPARARD